MDINNLKTSDFDYDLPKELIAQTPLKDRTGSRMMVVHMNSGELEDKHFYDIVSYFHKGDVLVRNNTRVIPARLYGTKEGTGAHVELLLLRQMEDDVWECLVGNAHVIKLGTVVSFHDGRLKAKCVEVEDKGLRKFKMIYDGIFNEILDQLGEVPLPPYIHEKLNDPERYQTVYSKVEGSAAAPTAGLHFTPEIFAKLREKGVTVVDVTLHVGLGTFRPMDTENVKEHQMHAEVCYMSKEAADILNQAKAEGRRIIAIGTTSVRTLESVWNKYGSFHECTMETRLFIYPGYQYHTIDGMLTNFHLPKSTLIMMICALAGYDLVMKAYKHAVDEKYRFFSFGDCMFLTHE
ncbi:tRNA preQ1(34) S-adenosylmethionine ribosyltransferase-isomerase QueA [Stecheria sp. CLA-KB-P133]|uniref:S-adenosylmethionine:tRNA ribosyltransferase-isomerase n=1 Tax=Grylomicrobium aquisgranensis TaxID=2926318 RepID=A0AB35TZU0_9FIRM|nr:tRNA preQ1(34) S-adenosylmethionine ribosyltransferase-isomerase QueA [Lactimicrobium massiliense]MDX8418588.1 tRNA preQ1(34) S-adenosylmethionine ribosyltransferase-isomerase QueA [Stecheria sp. CLA-KB-P133]MDY3930818.1 tRNA preQ1(34) S-adenosylmethionine ribosyltransferase-isomerase QueA [Erysipelotrichaceae bacterium]MDD6229871.1 tRNA preQ1(34) S-adenosylmethionine ribosyltransferase-isomerase QueA [Lactimicrobium massiliense]MDD6459008.1 tRNA preQ1(34) S-adenosylmethionine ribosyltransfe